MYSCPNRIISIVGEEGKLVLSKDLHRMVSSNGSRTLCDHRFGMQALHLAVEPSRVSAACFGGCGVLLNLSRLMSHSYIAWQDVAVVRFLEFVIV